MPKTARGGCSSRTSTACRNFANASNAFCVRTSVTFFATTKSMTEFIGPRFLVYAAALEMHPLDIEDRVGDLREMHGIGYCNITKCCTKGLPGKHNHHR